MPAADRHSAIRWVLRGMRHAVSIPTLVLFASYIGFGALLRGAGFPVGAGVLSTLLIWALPAQVILVGGVVAGTALPALALAVGLSSMRFLPMTMSIAPLLRGTRRSLFREILTAHYVAMTMWLEGLRLLPQLPHEARLPFAMGMGNTYISVSMIGTAAGFFLAGEVPPALALGLLFLTPLSFSILLVRNASIPSEWLALGAGFGLAPFTIQLGGGMDLMIAGIGGGTLAYLIGRRWGRAA